MPQAVILDLDSTLHATYRQAGHLTSIIRAIVTIRSSVMTESFPADELTRRVQNNKADYAVVYGEFIYKAGS